jgi:hypothetical protein
MTYAVLLLLSLSQVAVVCPGSAGNKYPEVVLVEQSATSVMQWHADAMLRAVQ